MIIIIVVIPTLNYYTSIVQSRRLLYDLQKEKNNDYFESFGLSRTILNCFLTVHNIM